MTTGATEFIQENALNNLSSIDGLGNHYFAMRHGHSLANQQGIIVSDPANGCGGYGLSETGRAQVRACRLSEHGLDGDTVIVSSDFARALESAQIVQELLGSGSGVTTNRRLRERFFGDLELGPDNAYDDVWRQDLLDPSVSVQGAETAERVMARVTGLIVELEREFHDRHLLLVSHGDALQILQTAFARRPASEHRDLDHLNTAEIRPLSLSPSVP